MSETTNLKLFKQDNPTTNTNNFDIEKTLNENWDKLDENAGTTNKKLESLEKVDSTTNETITAIKEEQTTQNENIEKNAEGIAQNKKDVDEELTKIKKENKLLKAQIPEGQASGNDIHLEDSSNMPFECKPRGGSRQETTEGYNLLNVENDFKVTNLEANKVVEIHLKANVTYTIKCDEIETDNTELKSCLFRFQYDSADVANPYARIPIATKTTTYTPPEDINSVRIYSGTSHNESATTNTTFKNLMIYEGTENKPYEPYTGENPSPSLEYPSKIENVGDNINLFNKNDTNCIFDTAISNNTLGIKASGTYKTVCVPCKANTIYSISKKYDEIKNRLTVACSNDMPDYSKKIENLGGSEMATNLTVTTSNTAKYLLAYVWVFGGSTTYQEMLDSIKIEEGIKATNYSDYNCGSVGVTISNKNLYKIEKVINDTNYSKIIYKDENGNVSFTTGGIPLIIAPTKTKEKTEYTYILKCKSNVATENNINFTAIYEDGTSELLSANKKKDTNEFIVNFKTNKEKTLAYVTQKYTNSARTTIITEGTMILEGDYLNLDEPYEIHQEQEIIFPLAEGQKLYEGSYLEKDGIHNKRKQIILNGTENWMTNESQQGENTSYFYETQSDMKIASNLISDKFIRRGTWGTDVEAISSVIDNYIRIRINTDRASTIDEFKKWLAENPVLVEYELAQEEIIPYTPEQQAVIDKILYTYKKVTNISVDNELATLDITYKKDIETMFNNQAKEYNERLSNIENLLNTTETSALLLDNLENDLEKEV